LTVIWKVWIKAVRMPCQVTIVKISKDKSYSLLNIHRLTFSAIVSSVDALYLASSTVGSIISSINEYHDTLATTQIINKTQCRPRHRIMYEIIYLLEL